MADMGESDQLQRCPRCLYLLHGLPAQHRCPECGLEIDRRWRVFGGRLIYPSALRPLRVMLAVPFASVFCVFVLWSWRLVSRPGTITEWITVLLTGGVAALLVFAAYAKPNRFVAVGPDGVLVYRGPKHIDAYAWDRIGRARYNLLRKTLDIEVDNRPVRLGTFGSFRGSVWGAEECARCINDFERAARVPGKTA